LAEHDLGVLKVDHELATSKVEKINKARIEAETSLKDKTERLTHAELKLKEKEDLVVK